MARIHCGKCHGVFDGLTVFQQHSCVAGATSPYAWAGEAAALKAHAKSSEASALRSIDPFSHIDPSHRISEYDLCCARCGSTEENIACKYFACISDADLTQSRKIQSLFDQQQKRGAAYFMGSR